MLLNIFKYAFIGPFIIIKNIFVNEETRIKAMCLTIVEILLYLVNNELILPSIYILMLFYAAFCIYSSVRENTRSKEDYYEQFAVPNVAAGAYFSGMSKAEAKKEYARLLKIYHPDNVITGDETIARAIIEEYNSL